ncbi:MAG: hypothetical protein QOI48_2561 [Solirubrobacteraceae bacterium]|nr:hypothetical protein [Solirubrobacteraceae bacterium]
MIAIVTVAVIAVLIEGDRRRVEVLGEPVSARAHDEVGFQANAGRASGPIRFIQARVVATSQLRRIAVPSGDENSRQTPEPSSSPMA